MKRDNQKTAVYRWEWLLMRRFSHAGAAIAFQSAVDLALRAWRDYYTPDHREPTFHKSPGRGSYASSWDVHFGRSLTPITALHEIAHSIMGRRRDLSPALSDSPIYAAHGPEFARLVLDLYARYLKLPKGEIRSLGVHQKPRRVRFASPDPRRIPAPMPRAARREIAPLAEELARLRTAAEELSANLQDINNRMRDLRDQMRRIRRGV